MNKIVILSFFVNIEINLNFIGLQNPLNTEKNVGLKINIIFSFILKIS